MRARIAYRGAILDKAIVDKAVVGEEVIDNSGRSALKAGCILASWGTLQAR